MSDMLCHLFTRDTHVSSQMNNLRQNTSASPSTTNCAGVANPILNKRGSYRKWPHSFGVKTHLNALSASSTSVMSHSRGFHTGFFFYKQRNCSVQRVMAPALSAGRLWRKKNHKIQCTWTYSTLYTQYRYVEVRTFPSILVCITAVAHSQRIYTLN